MQVHAQLERLEKRLPAALHLPQRAHGLPDDSLLPRNDKLARVAGSAVLMLLASQVWAILILCHDVDLWWVRQGCRCIKHARPVLTHMVLTLLCAHRIVLQRVCHRVQFTVFLPNFRAVWCVGW